MYVVVFGPSLVLFFRDSHEGTNISQAFTVVAIWLAFTSQSWFTAKRPVVYVARLSLISIIVEKKKNVRELSASCSFCFLLATLKRIKVPGQKLKWRVCGNVWNDRVL